MAVALFIGTAMTLVILVIGIFGPRTLNQPLEEISQSFASQVGVIDQEGVAAKAVICFASAALIWSITVS
jgi:hypothetical protein